MCTHVYIHIILARRSQPEGFFIVKMRFFFCFIDGPIHESKVACQGSQDSKASQASQTSEASRDTNLLRVSLNCKLQQIDRPPLGNQRNCCFANVYMSQAGSTCCLEKQSGGGHRTFTSALFCENPCKLKPVLGILVYYPSMRPQTVVIYCVTFTHLIVNSSVADVSSGIQHPRVIIECNQWRSNS